MYEFTATASEAIPKNRFMTTTLQGVSDTEVGVEVTPDGYEVDFYTTQSFKKGDKITVQLDAQDVVWEIEAGNTIAAGRPVSNGPDGKAVDRENQEDMLTVGLALEKATKGDVLKMWRHPRLSGSRVNDIVFKQGQAFTNLEQRVSDLESQVGGGGQK